MDSCIFCSIIENKVSAEKLYEDSNMIIIKDIQPRAKLHYLMIPKTHYSAINEMSEASLKEFMCCVKKLGELEQILGLSGGYRMIINQGADGGQTINHLHVHILGGEKLPE